eukprot:CFRG6453T1
MPEGYSESAADYTGEVWPGRAEFGVDESMCTAHGKIYSKRVGQFLAQNMLQPFHLVVDSTSTRNNITATQIRMGLKEENVSSTAEFKNIFHSFTCTTAANITALGAMNNKYITVHHDRNENLIDMVQSMLGTGGLYELKSIPNEFVKGVYTGRVKAASTTTEAFLMERMSGLPAAWGKASDEEILAMSTLSSYYWNTHFSDYLASRFASALLANMMAALENRPGTTVFVGHDSNIASINRLLGLQYSDPLYGDKATAPLSRLVFDLRETDAGERYISGRYQSITLDGYTSSQEGIQVTFLGEKLAIHMAQGAFKSLVRSKLTPDCL